MRESFFIFFLDIFTLLFSISCSHDKTQLNQWTEERVNKLLDSAHVTKLIATYKDIDGYTLIIKNDTTDIQVRKVTCIQGFPAIIDSLTQTGTYEFKSNKFRTTYVINDSEVVATYLQKIIHPSSNWQGQTPWQEIIIANYPRLDRKLK